MFIPATRMSSALPLSKAPVPKFSGEEGEPSRRAEKRPLEESGEPSEQPAKRLQQLEEHGTNTFFKAFLDEFGEPSQPPQPPQPPVQDPNVPFLDNRFYEPFMERHGTELLQDAVRQYTDIKTKEPEKLRDAYWWIMRLLKNGANPNSTPPEVPVINRALNNKKYRLAQKMRTHGAHILPENVTRGIREHLFKLIRQLERDNTLQQRTNIDNAIKHMLPSLNLPGMNLAMPEWPKPHTQPSLRTLLHWAANKGHLLLTQTILNAGVPVDIRSEYGTPLEEILSNIGGSDQITLGNPLEVVDALIAANADVNRRDALGKSLLSRACVKNVAFSEKLMDAGADPNTPVPLTLKTPLHQAISTGNKRITEKLLQHGADVNAKVVTGVTPLIQALQDKYLDIAEAILEHPLVDVNLPDNEGRTPISYAAELKARNANALVVKLLEKGANPFIASKSGKTPLIYAVENNREKNIQALVLGNLNVPVDMHEHLNYASAIVNQADGNGIKPLVWAKMADSPNTSTIKLLEEYTEDPLIRP